MKTCLGFISSASRPGRGAISGCLKHQEYKCCWTTMRIISNQVDMRLLHVQLSTGDEQCPDSLTPKKTVLRLTCVKQRIRGMRGMFSMITSVHICVCCQHPSFARRVHVHVRLCRKKLLSTTLSRSRPHLFSLWPRACRGIAYLQSSIGCRSAVPNYRSPT